MISVTVTVANLAAETLDESLLHTGSFFKVSCDNYGCEPSVDLPFLRPGLFQIAIPDLVGDLDFHGSSQVLTSLNLD